jgi:hypothetical protein
MPYREWPLLAAATAASDRVRAAVAAAGVLADADELGSFGPCRDGVLLLARDSCDPDYLARFRRVVSALPGCEASEALGSIWLPLDWGL